MKRLPKVPDRTKLYYKITNRYEIHYKLEYHNGIVIDHQEFDDNPEHSCVTGGIYFTTKEYLHRFFNMGIWIRPVTIPSDAKVILDPSGNKYRADRLFFHPRKNMKLYFNKLFDKKTFPKNDYNWLAMYCSKYFDRWFDKRTFPEEDCWYLATYCLKHFDKWFNKRTFPERYYLCLQTHCSKQLEKRGIKL